MSTFDAEIFTHAILEEAHSLLSVRFGPTHNACVELSEMRNNIEATLAALEIERRPDRVLALRDDLNKFLPVRVATIMERVVSSHLTRFEHLEDVYKDKLQRAFDGACRATTVVARAFVCGNSTL